MIPFATDSKFSDTSPIRTGTMLDRLSGIGGLPRRKITEIWGTESVGKSTICFQSIASAQAQGFRCLFADVEWGYDIKYAESLGVDNSKLGLIQEEHAETVLDLIEEEVKADRWDLIFIDSIGALLTTAEAEKMAGEKTIGGQASIVARFMRKIVPQLSLHNVGLVVINHGFIDIMSGVNKPSGGQKLAYHKSFSVRLRVNSKLQVKQGDKKIGKVVIGIVTKNKLAKTEGMETESSIIFGEGFSASQDMLGDAIERGVITKTGNSYFFKGEKLGMITKVREMMKDPGFAQKIKDELQ